MRELNQRRETKLSVLRRQLEAIGGVCDVAEFSVGDAVVVVGRNVIRIDTERCSGTPQCRVVGPRTDPEHRAVGQCRNEERVSREGTVDVRGGTEILALPYPFPALRVKSDG